MQNKCEKINSFPGTGGYIFIGVLDLVKSLEKDNHIILSARAGDLCKTNCLYNFF